MGASEVDKVKKELEVKLEELKIAQKNYIASLRSSVVKSLDEYTALEKIEAFDLFYKSAERELIEREKGNFSEDNDNDHYTWEANMELLAKDSEGFWSYYNSITKLKSGVDKYFAMKEFIGYPPEPPDEEIIVPAGSILYLEYHDHVHLEFDFDGRCVCLNRDQIKGNIEKYE